MPNLNNLRFAFQKPKPHFILLAIFGIYALLLIPTIDRLGIGWDEATDLMISRTYLSLSGLFFGSTLDPSQTRLPMFLAAMIFRLLGTSNLLTARFMTVIVGGLTLLGLYVYGRKQIDQRTGLLAAGLLAINPYFLSFARSAFTESDIYLACTLIWLLVVMAGLQKKRTLGYAALSGVLLGFSISSKATALVVLPALFGAFILLNVSRRLSDVMLQNHIQARVVLLWSGAGVVIFAAGVALSSHLDQGDFRRLYHLSNYLLVWLVWLGILSWAMRFRHHAAHPVALFTFLMTIGFLTFVVLPPEHLVNSGVIQNLVSRAETELTLSFAFIGELAAFHLFTIIFKSTPLLGMVLIAGFAFSMLQWRRDMILPLLVIVTYYVGLLLLPLAQTFYMIAVLPILSMVAADQLWRLYIRQRRLAMVLIISALIWWGVEMRQSYPDYHLNGYQWLGERPFFGRSSLGYRSIVYVPSDGVEQVIEWLNENAGEGEVVQMYIGPWHIVNSMARNPAYRILDGSEETLATEPDYVVIHIGAIIRQGEGRDNPQGSIFRFPFDPEVLYSKYEQVFVVQRTFDIEVASVWKRK